MKKTKASYINSDTIKIGVFWFVLTIIFEFSFGGLVMGNPIEKLIADYYIFEGRTWALFLLCVLIGPYVVQKFLLKDN